MPNKFLDWVDDSNINNTQTYADFEIDEQRKQGFRHGTAASEIRVNTALRQANLVANAIMDVVAPNDTTLNFKSKRTDVATKIRAGLVSLPIENAKKVNNLEIKRDENGVLKIGDTIIPQRKLLWSGSAEITRSAGTTVTLNDEAAPNDIIEIEYKIQNQTGSYFTKFRHIGGMTNIQLPIIFEESSQGTEQSDFIDIYTSNVGAALTSTTITFDKILQYSGSGRNPVRRTMTILNIYKVIE